MAERDLLDVVGGHGPWQIRIFWVLAMFGLPLAHHNLIMTFYAPNVDHWCARPDDNWTLDEWKLYGLPTQDPKCSRYDVHNLTYKQINSSTLKVMDCDSWEYDETIYGSTLLSKWNLVCDREWLVSMSKSIFIGGFLFSVIVFGYFADKYGRKLTITVCNVIAVVFSSICIFSTSFLMFAVCRFFIAVGVAGALTSSYVLMMEVIGSKYRSFYGIAFNVGWCVGFIFLPLAAWLIKDWVWLQVVITIPLVVLLSSWWLVPESPKWLMTKGDDEQALQVLLAAGKANGLADSHDELKRMMSKTSKVYEVKQSYGSQLHLIKESGIWKHALIVFYLWFVIAFVYFGLTFNTNELAGDPYVNFAVSGAIEVPSYVLTFFVIATLGRKGPQGVSLASAGVACLIMYIIPEDPWWLGFIVSMIGKFCISAAFGIVYVYTTEIFPTSIRAMSLGLASMMGRVGSIIAPFVRELGNATHPVVPQVVFGVLAVIGGALVIFLPETNNVTVPNTLGETAKVNRKEKEFTDCDETKI